MAGKGLSGQLSMFDFWSNIDGSQEVQMVSLMPEECEEDETSVEPDHRKEAEKSVIVAPRKNEETDTPKETETPKVTHAPKETLPTPTAAVMHREILAEDGSVAAEISFLNYNRVYVKHRGMEGEYRQFDNAKDAVDFYIDEMWKLS